MSRGGKSGSLDLGGWPRNGHDADRSCFRPPGADSHGGRGDRGSGPRRTGRLPGRAWASPSGVRRADRLASGGAIRAIGGAMARGGEPVRAFFPAGRRCRRQAAARPHSKNRACARGPGSRGAAVAGPAFVRTRRAGPRAAGVAMAPCRAGASGTAPPARLRPGNRQGGKDIGPCRGGSGCHRDRSSLCRRARRGAGWGRNGAPALPPGKAG